jgi:prepilin-type N-terminal cleavage/methylation domain-containing protein
MRPGLLAQDGWTLMETMVVTTIIAILSAIAIPQFSALSTQMRTNAAANELLGDVEYARTMSQRTGYPYYINVTAGAGVNYKVQRATNPAAIAPATDPTVRTITLGTKLPNVVFAQNGATTDCFGGGASTATPSTQLVFNSRGLPNAAAAYFVGSQDGKNTYVVSVTGAGRARMCRRIGGGWR